MNYIDDDSFRLQTKYLIKKIILATRKLPELNKGRIPYLKLTYYDCMQFVK